MNESIEAPRTNDLHQTDFYGWIQEQARAVEERRWHDVDPVQLADEIRSLGNQVRREMEDRLVVLVSYLLKWRHLAEYRGAAWKENIDRQRREMAELLQECPSLSELLAARVPKAYDDGRRHLKYETYFYATDFPATCPFSIEQVFDPAYYPEDLDAPALS